MCLDHVTLAFLNENLMVFLWCLTVTWNFFCKPFLKKYCSMWESLKERWMICFLSLVPRGSFSSSYISIPAFSKWMISFCLTVYLFLPWLPGSLKLSFGFSYRWSFTSHHSPHQTMLLFLHSELKHFIMCWLTYKALLFLKMIRFYMKFWGSIH